eukprot:CAMPEP_0173435390 /NCGR_PEP_ID=MMETSP1357-20121228/14998_1 /TAXON_ID=77926 /ORGANISM="Hemiselmis rufescens, Strain PCC563" /LENGTH=228 /DNA_ID=CAMNT_0014400365 /DNA_START=197 /DNA_END=880 /DNA_ORIENTATION=-
MAKQRRYREKTSVLVSVLEQAIYANKHLCPAISSDEDGFQRRRSKNQVLIDCIGAVKKAKEIVSAAKGAAQAGKAAKEEQQQPAADASAAEAAPSRISFREMICTSEVSLGMAVLRPDGSIAGMNSLIARMLPPLDASSLHCHIISVPTAIWQRSEYGPMVCEVTPEQLVVSFAPNPPFRTTVPPHEQRAVIVILNSSKQRVARPPQADPSGMFLMNAAAAPGMGSLL